MAESSKPNSGLQIQQRGGRKKKQGKEAHGQYFYFKNKEGKGRVQGKLHKRL